MEFLGTDALELGAGTLRSADGRELGHQIRFPGSVQGLELGRAGVRQVVEIKGVRYDPLQLIMLRVLLCPRTKAEGMCKFGGGPTRLILLIQGGGNVDLASLTTQDTAATGENGLGHALQPLGPHASSRGRSLVVGRWCGGGVGGGHGRCGRLVRGGGGGGVAS